MPARRGNLHQKWCNRSCASFATSRQSQIPEEELKRAKDQLKGSLMLSLESSTARMSNLARQEMYYDHFMGMDEIIDRIQEVTLEDVIADGERDVPAGGDCGDGAGEFERAEDDAGFAGVLKR